MNNNDLWLWVVNGALGILVAALGLVFGVVFSVVGFLVHRIHNRVDQLGEHHDANSERISKLEVTLAQYHPTKADFQRLEDGVKMGFDGIRETIRMLFEKIDRKADK